ncbi:MAG: heavy metal translocating P-type ATPase [Nitrospiraceae bacterium]|nr:MAG: heavy metal translocating P-type ATPase [Nitrospiraceae bacterium]
MPICDHCLLEFPGREAVHVEVNGQKKVFCCHGCNGIYRLINDEGLSDFYDRRDSWVPGPADDKPVDIAAFNENLRQAGNEIETDIVLDGIRCASCVWLNEKILLKTNGVTYANVNYATHRAKVRWDPEKASIDKIVERIKSIGYTPKPFVAKAYEMEMEGRRKDLLLRFGTASFFSMQLMLYSVALYAGYFQGIDKETKNIFHWISLLLTTPVLFYSGMPFIKGAAGGLRHLNFNMNLLVATGAGSAYLYSIHEMFSGGKVYFDTSAMIITLILLGRYIEAGAKGKASQALTHLLSLSPKEARRIAGADVNTSLRSSESIPISSIKAGDMIEVVPGEKIPLDGTVIEGSSEVDESMLTGESRPVSKAEGSDVFCGTQNLYGNFIFRVKRAAGDTVLSQIIKTVEDAQARRAPVQAAADRVVGIFVPAILFLSLVTCVYRLSNGGPATEAVMNAVSVLVIACPCALGLATPLAILAGTANGASKGILIKGGDVIEKSRDIGVVVLDKTGTITEGHSVLSSFHGIGIPDETALCLAASLERLSEHSIGKAIVGAARGLKLHDVTDFKAYPGRGISGGINGKGVLIGNRTFMTSYGIDIAHDDELLNEAGSRESTGATVVYLSYDGKLAGTFSVSDTVRKEAAEVIQMLKHNGLDVVMITGDNLKTATAVSREAGIDTVKAQMSPVEKAEEIRHMQEKGRRVIMVGDGINDAPALVQADVGIAMGRATDIALESSDMVLMRNDLRLLPDAVSLSKKTFSIIRQNIFWAFFYNAVAVPLAVLGILHPIVAAGAMALSSLSVAGNSLRLTRVNKASL